MDAFQTPAADFSAALASRDEEYVEHAVELDLREQGIGYVVPVNSMIRGELLLSTGAVIAGTFCGRLVCSQGTVALLKGSVFEGEIEAEKVWIDGDVRNISPATAQLLGLTARTTPEQARPAMGGLINGFRTKLVEGGMSRIVGRSEVCIAASATGRADVCASSFAAHGKKFAARYFPFNTRLGG